MVNFDEKWRDLSETITAVVHLRPVKRMTWNNNISYPLPNSITTATRGYSIIVNVSIIILAVCSLAFRDIYALCAALPKSFAETLYEQTHLLLEDCVTKLAEVRVVLLVGVANDYYYY